MAAELLGDESPSISYMYSGFAMTTLPHRPLADDALWEKRNGRLTLLVEPGFLYEGESSVRSEEHTSELQSLMRISYAVFCLKKKKTQIEQRKRESNNQTHNLEQLCTHWRSYDNTGHN